MIEYWDLYDNNLIKTKQTISSTEPIPEGYYHIALELWMINDDNKLLMIKNSIDYSKRYPGSWCCIGGNLCSNETIENAIKRILYEKIGINISLDNKIIGSPVKRDPHKYAYITCILFNDIDLDKISFNDKNSTDARFIDKDEIINMEYNGEIAYYLIERINNEIISYLK